MRNVASIIKYLRNIFVKVQNLIEIDALLDTKRANIKMEFDKTEGIMTATFVCPPDRELLEVKGICPDKREQFDIQVFSRNFVEKVFF